MLEPIVVTQGWGVLHLVLRVDHAAVPSLPDGSREEPLRWESLMAAAAGAAASGLALRWWRRRR